jgi:hypothetical protein
VPNFNAINLFLLINAILVSLVDISMKNTFAGVKKEHLMHYLNGDVISVSRNARHVLDPRLFVYHAGLNNI